MTEALEMWIMSGIMIFAISAVGVLTAWIGLQARKVLPWWPIMRTDERERQQFISNRRRSSESDSF